MKNSKENKKVLLLALSGIGNFLMQSPVFAAIKKTHPDWHLTVWVTPRGTKTLAENNPHIDRVIEMPIRTSPLQHIKQIKQLRKEKFDIGLVLSPGQLLKSAAYLQLAGIPMRIGHQYPLGSNLSSFFLLTHTIPEDPALHDIEQNLALLRLLKIAPDVSTYQLTIPQSAHGQAQKIWQQLNIPLNKTIIGFHPGSAPHFKWKRWPLENWIELGRAFIEQNNAHLLIFGGPDEEDIKQRIAQDLRSASVISTNLLTAAAIMQKCRLFITNDSGLMHLASASGVSLLALFGPTNEKQTGPRGPQTHILRAPHTKPVYNTEKNPGLGQHPHETLEQLSPQAVLQETAKLL